MFPSTTLSALALSLLFTSSPAWAQGAEGDAELAASELQPTLDQARSAFVEGRELLKQEKWAEAAQRFAFAARSKNTPGLRYYIGYCLEKEGKLVAALSQYRLAAELLQVERAHDVEALVQEAIPRLEKETPRLVLKGVPQEATLRIDGTEQSLQAKEYMLDPGQHEVTVLAPGYFDSREVVGVKRNSTAILQLQMRVKTTSFGVQELAPMKEEPVQAVNHGRRAALWGSVAAGTVGLGLGIAGVAIHQGGKRDVDRYGVEVDRVGSEVGSNCYAPSTFELAYYCDELSSALNQEARGRSMTIAGFTVAGIGAVGATLTMLFWPTAEASESESATGWSPGKLQMGGLSVQQLEVGGFIAGRRDWQLGLSGAF